MSSQQLDLFDDYAVNMQNEQAADSLATFYKATGILRATTLVFGAYNPIYEKEVFVSETEGKNMGVFYQIVGNMGGYANKEFLDDTDIILLPDDSLRKLEQGVKDDVILHIENLYSKKPLKFQKLRFTCESDFLGWVKRRMETSPDEGTIRLLQIYEKS